LDKKIDFYFLLACPLLFYEKVGTVFQYKKYNFFDVNVDGVESDRQKDQPFNLISGMVVW
jgi:hypothetical protein